MTNFSVNFSNPWLLLLLIPAVGFTLLPYFRVKKKYRRTRNRIVSIVLHMLIMVLCITVFAGIRFTYDIPNRENEVLLLVDDSYSGERQEAQKKEFVEKVIDSSNSLFKIGVVTFGYDQVYAAKLTNNTDSVYSQYLRAPRPDNSATDIAAALTYASTLFEHPKTARIVLLSDGIETDGKAQTAIKNVAQMGIKVDTVFFSNEAKEGNTEVQLVQVTTPDQSIKAGDKFNIDLTLQSSYKGQANIHLYDNGKLLSSKTVDLLDDESELQTFGIEAQFILPGMHKLSFEMETVGGGDLLQNNSFKTYMYLEVFDQILVIESIEEESASLRDMLNDNLNVKVVNTGAPDTLPQSLDQIRLYDEVIMVNVSNEDLPAGFVDNILHPYVNEIGGGLFTVCGNEIDENPSDEEWFANAYTKNDMYGTTYQKMLPVEIVNYTPPLAVMIIIDRSGSMYSPEGNIPYEQSKLYAAQQGAEACLDALTERDYVGIMTLEDKYSEEIKLTPRTQRDKILKAIENVKGEGGGTIFSYALEYAGRALTACSEVEKRHIIIVTDGEPGDKLEQYGPWVEENKKKGITLSIVGIEMGEEAQDRMMEMIELAGGTSKNLHVVVDVDRVATEMREDLMVDEIKDVNYKTFTPKISMYNSVVAGLTQAEMPTLNGFYGVKAKEDSEVVLMGEYSPLYAQWKYGKGMVGSFMCDLNGVWSSDFIGTDAATKLINNIVTTLFPVENIRSKDIEYELIEQNYTSKLNIYTEMAEGDKIEVQVTSPTADGSEETRTIAPTPEEGYTQIPITITVPGVHTLLIQKKDANGNLLSETKAYKTFSYSQEYNAFKNPEECEAFLAELAEDGRGIVVDDPMQIFENVVKFLHRVIDPRLAFIIASLVMFLLDVAVRKFKFKWPHEIIRDHKAKKELGKK